MITKLSSPAKLNLCLWVNDRDATGFHKIKTIYQTVSLHDVLEATSIPKKTCTVIPTKNSLEFPTDDSNSIVKAYQLVKERMPFGIKVKIQKNIPVYSGLGGGCSNAATILKHLNQFCVPMYSKSDLNSLAKRIGCDVPFFLEGGTMLMEGYGETTVCTFSPDITKFLLINSPTECCTTKVYKKFDQLQEYRSKYEKPDMPTLANMGENDLEEAALILYPQLRILKEKLKSLGIYPVYMTGSGSTLFVPVHDEMQGLEWQKRISVSMDHVTTEMVTTYT